MTTMFRARDAYWISATYFLNPRAQTACQCSQRRPCSGHCRISSRLGATPSGIPAATTAGSVIVDVLLDLAQWTGSLHCTGLGRPAPRLRSGRLRLHGALPPFTRSSVANFGSSATLSPARLALKESTVRGAFGKNLVRIQNALWVQHPLDLPH